MTIIEYLCQPEQLAQMIDLITKSSDDDPQRMKNAYTVTEIIKTNSPLINEAIFETKELFLERLFNFFSLQVYPEVHSKLVRLVIQYLMNNDHDQMLKYISSNDDIVESLCSHMDDCEVMDLMFLIIKNIPRARDSKADIEKWINRTKFTEKLLELLSPSQSHLVVSNVVYLINEISSTNDKDKNIIFKQISSPASWKIILDLTLIPSNPKSHKACGIEIIISLLQKCLFPAKLVQIIDILDGPSSAPSSVPQIDDLEPNNESLPPSIPALESPSKEEDPAVIDVQTIDLLNIVLSYMKELVEILNSKPTSSTSNKEVELVVVVEEEEHTTSNQLKLGKEKYWIINLLSLLFNLNSERVDEVLYEPKLEILNSCINILFEYQWNNVVHVKIFDIISHILKCKPWKNQSVLFIDCRLIEKVYDAIKLNNNQLRMPKGSQIGCIGFVYRIVDLLTSITDDVNNKKTSSQITDFILNHKLFPEVMKDRYYNLSRRPSDIPHSAEDKARYFNKKLEDRKNQPFLEFDKDEDYSNPFQWRDEELLSQMISPIPLTSLESEKNEVYLVGSHDVIKSVDQLILSLSHFDELQLPH
eukprot:TRINITY_DN498_c3_g1_i1.p1 TRINITY_DN498_c3_g1~~TRINITY_DN498_c3_g1_i1.p1  ORF type:complete len:638 (+),score=152.24 TRINITY_DN498_c3_g1_i1:151-1914(+)